MVKKANIIEKEREGVRERESERQRYC